MDRMIAYCGITCTECPAFLATQNDDDDIRKKTAEQWSKEYNCEMKPEDINCVGCMVETGLHIGHWNECGIRKCGQEKNVKNCAYCDDFACEKLSEFFKAVPDAKATLEEIRKNL